MCYLCFTPHYPSTHVLSQTNGGLIPIIFCATTRRLAQRAHISHEVSMRFGRQKCNPLRLKQMLAVTRRGVKKVYYPLDKTSWEMDGRDYWPRVLGVMEVAGEVEAVEPWFGLLVSMS